MERKTAILKEKTSQKVRYNYHQQLSASGFDQQSDEQRVDRKKVG